MHVLYAAVGYALFEVLNIQLSYMYIIFYTMALAVAYAQGLHVFCSDGGLVWRGQCV